MSTEIVVGDVDSDPNNNAPSFLVDANPLTGNISDVSAGNFIQMIEGLADGKQFTITSVQIDNNRYKVAENLFSEGVRSGDRYRIVDSFFVLYDDVNDVDRIRLDPERADSALLQRDIWNRLILIEDILRGDKIIEGKIDSISGATITISNPTFGNLIDAKAGYITEIVTSVKAERKRFRITSSTATTILHDQNLEDEGVGVNDVVRVIHGLTASQTTGHIHDGVDSVLVPDAEKNHAIAFFGGMY